MDCSESVSTGSSSDKLSEMHTTSAIYIQEHDTREFIDVDPKVEL